MAFIIIVFSTGCKQLYMTAKGLYVAWLNRNGSERNKLCKVCKDRTCKSFAEKHPLSVREISKQLGFATRNDFSAVFRQVAGRTPMVFREK